MKIAGVVLAGGLSRRMGGEEKSLMSLADRPVIQWVADELSKRVEQIAVNANGDPARFAFLNLPVIADAIEGFVGPLAGVHAGMRWAATFSGYTHILTTAADTPFLPSNLLKRLQEPATKADTVTMANSVGRVHPVFALWPIHLVDDLEKFLVEEDKRKILEFANRYSLVEVGFDDLGW